MIIKENESLGSLTTFRVGGNIKKLYMPESEDELIRIASDLYQKDRRIYIISGGSNILANDEREFESVISMKSACTDIYYKGENEYYVGSSVRIQKVISFVNDNDCGGFEELVGLPAMFGGILCMNAGIGGKKASKFTISDFVESVTAYNLKKETLEIIENKECHFSHRSSIFQNGEYVILGATIKCRSISKSAASELITARHKFCKENFEYGKGCFGSCFSESRYKVLQLSSMLYRPFEKGIHFGRKNANWLYNDGSGRYANAISIINFCRYMHFVFYQQISLEVIIWS